MSQNQDIPVNVVLNGDTLAKALSESVFGSRDRLYYDYRSPFREALDAAAKPIRAQLQALIERAFSDVFGAASTREAMAAAMREGLIEGSREAGKALGRKAKATPLLLGAGESVGTAQAAAIGGAGEGR